MPNTSRNHTGTGAQAIGAEHVDYDPAVIANWGSIRQHHLKAYLDWLGANGLKSSSVGTAVDNAVPAFDGTGGTKIKYITNAPKIESLGDLMIDPNDDGVGILFGSSLADYIAVLTPGVMNIESTNVHVQEANPDDVQIGSSGNTIIMVCGIGEYNSIATVSQGVAPIYAEVNSTGLTANVGATTLYAVPSTGAGLYRVTAYVIETTAASVSSTLPNVQIVYTDAITSGAITINATPTLGAAGLGQTGVLTANAVGTVATGIIAINAKASTNIQYQTVNYASVAAGMAYALKIRLEAM